MAWWRRKAKNAPEDQEPGVPSEPEDDRGPSDESTDQENRLPGGFIIMDEDAARPADDPSRSPYWRNTHPEHRFRSFTHLKREDLGRLHKEISDARMDLYMLFHLALENDIQSINFEPAADSFRVRMKSGREWETVLEGERKRFDAIVSELGRMIMDDPEFLPTFRWPHTGVINIDYPDGDWKAAICESLPGIDGPIIHVYFQSSGEKGFVLDLDNLGIRHVDLVKIKSAVDQPKGLVVIAGPTGAGKSVLCYSALVRAQMRGRSVATVERPKKFLLPGAVQVGLHGSKNYVDGMAIALAHDPDVLMLQEADGMRGLLPVLEEARNRLLIIGYHNYNSISMLRLLMSAVYRKDEISQAFEAGTGEYTAARALAERLLLVTGSRLLPRLCPHCRVAHTLDPGALQKAGMTSRQGHNYHHYGTTGCEACGHAGFAGLESVFEVLPVTPAVLEAAEACLRAADGNRDETDPDELDTAYLDAQRALEQTALREGMRPMRHVGLDKVLEGKVRLKDVLMKTPAPFA